MLVLVGQVGVPGVPSEYPRSTLGVPPECVPPEYPQSTPRVAPSWVTVVEGRRARRVSPRSSRVPITALLHIAAILSGFGSIVGTTFVLVTAFNRARHGAALAPQRPCFFVQSFDPVRKWWP